MLPHALITERCLDYPYNGWKLRCVKPEKAILDIITKRLNIRIEIGSGFVILRDRPEKEFSSFVNKKLSPSQLLKNLLICGVNLLPVIEDADTANICRKSVESEEHAINDISIWIKAFYVKSSRWSTTLPGE